MTLSDYIEQYGLNEFARKWGRLEQLVIYRDMMAGLREIIANPRVSLRDKSHAERVLRRAEKNCARLI